MSFTVCCVNVRGIRQVEKRRDVLNYLRSLRCGLYCLVDTHFTAEMVSMVRSEWGGEVLISCGTANSRGVAVLLNPSAAVLIHGFECDCHGNYIIMDIEFDGFFRCTYVVIYGPNEDSPNFYEQLFSSVSAAGDYPVILVGDWNLVLDFQKDTKFYSSIGNPRAREVVLEAMDRENFIDIWREQHADVTQYTWRKSNPAKFSRLDFFLISAELLQNVQTSDIVHGYRTDHSVITLTFKAVERSKRKPYWKFNNSLLDDKTFISTIKKEILYMKELYALPVYSRQSIENDRDIKFSISDQLFFETLLCHLRGIIV